MIFVFFSVLSALVAAPSLSLTHENHTRALISQLMSIDQQLQKKSPTLIQHFLEPKYRFTQITHTSISIQNPNTSTQQIQMYNSFNIYNSDKTSYPILLRHGNSFYSVSGKKIVSFSAHSRVLVSSSRGQFTYFAQITNLSVYIKKLGYIHGKPQIQQQFQIDINDFKTEIASFSVAFSLNKKLFAFGTSKGVIRFYKSQGFVMERQLGVQADERIDLLRLNNHLLAYSKTQIYIIQSSNPKTQNIQKCLVPQLDALGIRTLKYDSANFKHFYLMANSHIYIYSYQLKCQPIAIYPLAFHQNQTHHHLQQFIPASNMLLMTYPQYPSLYLYYNITDKSYHKFILPKTHCPSLSNTYIQVSPKTSTDYMLCDFCSEDTETQAKSSKIKFSCYSLQIGAPSQKSDGTEFSKLRIPLIIASLFIIVYFGITKSKKKKEEGPYEKMLTPDREAEDSEYKKFLLAQKSQKRH